MLISNRFHSVGVNEHLGGFGTFFEWSGVEPYVIAPAKPSSLDQCKSATSHYIWFI